MNHFKNIDGSVHLCSKMTLPRIGKVSASVKNEIERACERNTINRFKLCLKPVDMIFGKLQKILTSSIKIKEW
jgi:hypothetical protein